MINHKEKKWIKKEIRFLDGGGCLVFLLCFLVLVNTVRHTRLIIDYQLIITSQQTPDNTRHYPGFWGLRAFKKEINQIQWNQKEQTQHKQKNIKSDAMLGEGRGTDTKSVCDASQVHHHPHRSRPTEHFQLQVEAGPSMPLVMLGLGDHPRKNYHLFTLNL